MHALTSLFYHTFVLYITICPPLHSRHSILAWFSYSSTTCLAIEVDIINIEWGKRAGGGGVDERNVQR